MKILKTKFGIMLLIILSVLAYANSIQNTFVWDDYLVIADNDFVKSWSNLPAVFSKAYLTRFSDINYLGMRGIGSGETSYRPIVTISYFIDYHLWKLSPAGYHVTNLFLHLVNLVLVFALVNYLTKNRKTALLASLLFALHPVNAETVNVISFREDLLVFLFYIASLILYIRSDSCSGWKRGYIYVFSLLSFFLALFSKEMALTLPFILILYDYYFVFESRAKDILRRFKSCYAGYFIVCAFYLWVRFFIMVNKAGEPAGYAGGTFYSNILTMSRVFARYIQWLFFPVNIHATLPDDIGLISRSLSDSNVFFSIILLSACATIAFRLYRNSRHASFAIFWFFITLAPVANIFPITNYMASRYLYIPSVGFCFLGGIFFTHVDRMRIPFTQEDLLKRLAKDSVVIILIFYFAFTAIRNMSYKNDFTLWQEMAKEYPENAIAHSSMGSCFKKRGMMDRAIQEYKLALVLDPGYAKDHVSLGACYYYKGMLDEAGIEFKKAIELNPCLLEAYLDLGSVLGEKGRYEEAMDYFKQALEVNPGYAEAYNNIGVTCARMGRYTDAKKAWENALEIKPGDEKAQESLRKLKEGGH